ncbi:hypothetical protein Adt_36211 [Abeliophyllum distichum]|uniref:Transposase (putative) gypsy type domain-containing protein n=1 Tax=Abeliophyllum distichum TaxID=126358 RepID=A0ABD1QGY6_9LAMI
MRLPLHPMFRRILRAYGLDPTQLGPNGWSQMVGGMYLLFRHFFGLEMPLHVFQTVYQPRKLPKKKDREEEAGVVLFLSLRVSQALSDRLSLFRKTVEGVVVLSVWETSSSNARSFIEVEPKVLVPCSTEDTSQRKVIENLSWEGNRAEVAAHDVVEIEDLGAPEREAPLKRKMKSGASGS